MFNTAYNEGSTIMPIKVITTMGLEKTDLKSFLLISRMFFNVVLIFIYPHLQFLSKKGISIKARNQLFRIHASLEIPFKRISKKSLKY